MSSIDTVNLFLKRAKNFHEAAKDQFNKGNYDLACFLSEQALQLYLKATILYLTGELLRTHSIRTLLANIFEVTNDKFFKEFSKKHRFILKLMEQAYVATRYLPTTFSAEDADAMIRVVDEVVSHVNEIIKGDSKKS